jgi:UDP-N-acetylmuramate dehydrogenase
MNMNINKIKNDFSLKKYNTFGFDCVAKHFFKISQANTIAQYADIIDKYRRENRLLILGGGSNVVFAQNYFDGLVVYISDSTIHKDGIINEYDSDYIYMTAHAGCDWHKFVKYCTSEGCYGLENLAYIPGTVGACPVQNIGAYGVEASDAIENIMVFNLNNMNIEHMDNYDCEFGYRDSIFKHSNQYIILAVTFKLQHEKFNKYKINQNYEQLAQYLALNNMEHTAINVLNAVVDIRKSKLPNYNEIGNAGSFFKNPIITQSKLDKIKQQHAQYSAANIIPSYNIAGSKKLKLSAAWLIEQCGLKGFMMDKLGVYEKHALVLVNYGEEQGSKILALIKHIQQTVFSKFGIRLEPEVNIISNIIESTKK